MGKESMQNFLRGIGMLATDISMEEEWKRFLEHMRNGLKGDRAPEALQMIPTYLSLGKNVPINEKVIVIDAGGTNFRICTLYFDDKHQPIIENFQNMPMPGSQGEVSRQEFFGTIAEVLLPYLEYSQKIGFCFSYPAEITPNHDGKILGFTKEVQCPEAEGEILGESLRGTLADLGYSGELHVVVLNDTVAALLGGFAVSNMREFSSYVGFILGTGLNAAYIEENINIQKLRGQIPLLNNMLINIEAGNYFVSKQSLVDKLIDEASSSPGAYHLEKQISGRYQGLIAYHILQLAVEEESLFSDAFKQKFQEVDEIKSYQLDKFIDDPYGDNLLAELTVTLEDKDNVYYIIDAIFERAAILVSVLFAAIHEQTGKGLSPTKPLAITIEGTTYYKSEMFRNKLESYVKQFVNDKLGFYNEFLQVEHANLMGSAIAALVN